MAILYFEHWDVWPVIIMLVMRSINEDMNNKLLYNLIQGCGYPSLQKSYKYKHFLCSILQLLLLGG